MIENLEELINSVVAMEALLNQADEWEDAKTDYEIRIGILKQFAKNDQAKEMIETLKEHEEEAARLLSYCKTELQNRFGTTDLTTVRLRVTRLKVIMNKMMEKYAQDFANNTGLKEMKFEDMFSLAEKVLSGEKDD